MATDNDALVIKIKADIKSLQAGLRQAARAAETAGKEMETSLGGSAERVQKVVANMAAGIGSALTAVAGVSVLAGGALLALTKRSLEFSDALVKASDQTGIGTEALQEYRYAAAQAGVSTDELEQGLGLFTKRLGEARNGSQEAIKAFDALGISQDEIKKNSPEQTLQRVFDVLETIPNAADRAAYANEAFGKSGLRLAVMAGQGAGAIDEMRAKARELGLVVGDDLVRAGDDAGDSIDKLKAVIASGLNKAVLQAAPDIKAFVDEITSDPQKIQATANALIEVAKAGAQIATAFAGALSYAKDFGEWIAKLQGYSDIPYAAEIEALEEKISDLNANPLNFLSGPEYMQQTLAGYNNQLKELKALQADILKPNISTPPAVTTGGGTTPPRGLRSLGSAASKRDKPEEADQPARDIEDEQKRLEALAALQQKAADDALALRQQSYIMLDGALLDQQAMEMQQEQDSFSARLALLAQFSEDDLEAFGGYNAAKEQIWAEHNDRMVAIQQAALEKQVQNEIDAATRRFSFSQFAGSKEAKYAGALGDKALALGASQNKKIFELSKKLNLAQAIVALPTAVMESYKNAGGFPFGIPAAAAMGAIGLANIASIKNASYGGGASPNLPGAAAAGGGVVGDQNAPRGNGGGSASPQISLSLVGDNFSRDQVRQLIESINEALGDGAKLRTA